MYTLMRAEIQDVYFCMTCGVAALGQKRVVTFLPEQTALSPASTMPVGWSSYAGGFKCPTHTKLKVY